MTALFLAAALAATSPSAPALSAGKATPPASTGRPPSTSPRPHERGRRSRPVVSAGVLAVARANAAAHVAAGEGASLLARQVYAFTDGALFDVYAAPDRVTDIVLQPGEVLAGSGPVAAGDTVRWIIGDTDSGAGAQRQVHILVKPTRADLATNLVINTDRRTYHLDLHATAHVAMSEVSWRYAADDLVAIRRSPPLSGTTASAAAADPVLDLGQLHFGYRMEGDRPSWRPLRVFDDGRRVVIDFPSDAAADLPPLFVLDGKSAVLVNYRTIGRRMVVDHLFQAAELRLAGARGRAKVVRIIRQDKDR